MADNSKKKGDCTVGAVIGQLMKRGDIVCFPLSDNQRYDLIVDHENELLRVQCKTGRLTSNDSVVKFKCFSVNVRTQVMQRYEGQVDYFGVYCARLNKVYMVPFADAPKHECYLRVRPTKNGNRKALLASKYEI